MMGRDISGNAYRLYTVPPWTCRVRTGPSAGDIVRSQTQWSASDSGRRIAGYVLVSSGLDDSNAHYVRLCSSIGSRQATILDRQVLVPLVTGPAKLVSPRRT